LLPPANAEPAWEANNDEDGSEGEDAGPVLTLRLDNPEFSPIALRWNGDERNGKD